MSSQFSFETLSDHRKEFGAKLFYDLNPDLTADEKKAIEEKMAEPAPEPTVVVSTNGNAPKPFEIEHAETGAMARTMTSVRPEAVAPGPESGIEGPDANGEFSSPLAGALYAAARGIAQIPLRPRTKDAFLPNWQQLATTDAGQIRKWDEEYPDCNFGSVGKPGGKVIFERDSEDVPKRYAGTFSSQYCVQSSPGKMHYYYDNPGLANIAQNGNVHGDWSLRADDQYCVTAGSEHPDTGKQYRLVSFGDITKPTQQEIDFWNSERKPEKLAKPKSTDEGDPGFKKLFEQLGWEPLADRLRKHPDTRFNQPVLQPGKNMFCPMPPHYDHEETAQFKATPFGVERANPALLHCFSCQWSGDMVKACNEIDNHPASGGIIAPVSMYDTARQICQENSLKFEDFFPDQPKVLVETQSAAETDIDENSVAAIPPFDTSVMSGIYAKFVELVTRGTTLAPQFAFAFAKTVVGSRMSGKTKFENLDVEPRFYTTLIGETGSGKGEASRRMLEILKPRGRTEEYISKIKIVDSVDSGAGLRDLFWADPDDLPVLCYFDEVASLGNKSADTRNPAIIDQLIELADKTTISRVLARRSGGTKSKDDAHLSVVMCGQSGEVFTKAFAGRTKLGWYDRLYPEFSVAVEPGDLPPINIGDAYNLLSELGKLDYSSTLGMSNDCKSFLDAFWKGQPDDVRKKARWKKNLYLDAYMSAFGQGVRAAQVEDAVNAVKIFTRQLVIRRVCFTMEAPDRTGYYLGLIKRITKRMAGQLAAGVPEAAAAKSRRDYERETNAHRDNEEHIFNRAWDVHSKVHLREIGIKKANGQVYTKYLPVDDE